MNASQIESQVIQLIFSLCDVSKENLIIIHLLCSHSMSFSYHVTFYFPLHFIKCLWLVYRYYTHSDELKWKERKSFFLILHFTSRPQNSHCHEDKRYDRESEKEKLMQFILWLSMRPIFFDDSSSFCDKMPSFICNTSNANPPLL
ncbi:hypothetical protein ACKWTF_013686 [Chironomus riparius]